MLTVDALKEFGADTEDGLARCMNNQAFYLRLVGKVLEDRNFAALEQALSEGNLDAAFGAAHSLKGVLGNLSLTPIYEPVFEITEKLRACTMVDCTDLVEVIRKGQDELKNICEK